MDNSTENTIEYYLYHRSITSKSEDVAKKFEDLIYEYYAVLSQYLKDYIWQCQPFSLQSVSNPRDRYIFGRTHFDENIEDEWFIVFLLKQLTLFDPNLVVKVIDDDGDFLLIESAQYLERWAQEPTRTQNRVFLYRGDVHLISPKKFPKEHLSNASLSELIDLITNLPDKTRCNDSIQNCINNRIRNYPQAIKDIQHRAHCSLPAKIILLLESNPKLVAQAVRAFYYRTPDDISSIRSIKRLSTKECQVANIRFTHCLYAQLNSQQFSPKDDNIDLNISILDEKTKNIALNGIKLVVGFEILIANFLKNRNQIRTFERNEDKWNIFVDKLSKHVGNETPQSEKLHQFQIVFEEIQRKNEDCCHPEDYGNEIYEFIESISNEEIERISSMVVEPADDDTWLDIGEEELDQILAMKFGCTSKDVQKETFDSLKVIPNTLERFISDERSGLEGVEMPKKSSTCTNRVHFNENEYSNFMNKIKGLLGENSTTLSDEESSSSDNSEDEYSNEEDELEETSEEMKHYLESMHHELSETIIGKSFPKQNTELDSDDDSEEQKNFDLNVLTNILESYSAEKEVSSTSGPATTLFASMGVQLPEK